MKYLVYLILYFIFCSCGQDYNSNSFDDSIYVQTDCTGTESQIRFCNAFKIINNKCISCHTGFHNTYATFDSSEKWINAGLILQNNAAQSTLMIRLKGYGVTSLANMPQGASQLTQDEIDTLENWITGL